jgi:hypothetical protein
MKRKLTSELDRNMVIAFVQRLDIGKKLYTVEVLEKNANRSISQNSLMWLWLTCIEHETGQDRNELHEIFKKKWLMPKEIVKFETKVEIYTTTDLDTLQFKQYLDKIQILASTELGIALPEPESMYWQEFYEYYVDKL